MKTRRDDLVCREFGIIASVSSAITARGGADDKTPASLRQPHFQLSSDELGALIKRSRDAINLALLSSDYLHSQPILFIVVIIYIQGRFPVF